MKRIAPLFLLPLLLAACGQPSTPGPAAQLRNSAMLGHGGVAYLDTQAAYDAQVMADLSRLSAQGAQAKVYLNVLPLAKTDDSVRAYVKSSFATPVTCSVDWGDSSASTSVASPTVKSVETKDHAYATFGTYTITTTCLNGATVVGTQSLTVQAGKKVTAVTIGFDSPVAPAGSYLLFDTYSEKGFEIRTDGQLFIPSSGFAGFNSTSNQAMSTGNIGVAMNLNASDNSPFTLKSFSFRPLKGAFLSIIVTGTRADSTTVTTTVTNPTSIAQIAILDGNWTNLTTVNFSGSNPDTLLDDVTVSK